MNTHADKTQDNKSQSVTNSVSHKQSGSESIFQFEDNRPEAIAQRKLQEMAKNSSRVKQAIQFQTIADNYSGQQQQPIQNKENDTGIPNNLKTGIENLSGYSMDDVKVHYNSDKPAQLQAHAYAQGTDIYLGAGQEKHLSHEAWHVIQQKQGRVKPTMQLKGMMNLNDDAVLEKEADIMGAKAQSIGNSSTYQLFTPYSREMQSRLIIADAVQLAGVDLDMIKSGGNITWDYIEKLITQLNIEDMAANLIKELCTWFLDKFILPKSIQEYIDMIAPWLGIARRVVNIVEKIPATIRTSILYAVGYGIRKLSTSYLYGKISETHIHAMLSGTQDFSSALSTTINFLDKVVISPSGALFDLYNIGIFGGIRSYLFDTNEQGALHTNLEQSVTPEQSEQEPIIDANTGFFWINAQAPQLDKWEDDNQQNRAGMEMNARLGFKIFDNVIGTDNLKFRLPYNGDWGMSLTDVTLLDGEIGINQVLTANGIKADVVIFNQEGLQFVKLTIDKVVVGNDIVDARNTQLTWNSGQNKMSLEGNATINLLSSEFDTNLSLTMTKDGSFQSGKLDVKMLDTINMISGRLQVVNPEFNGSFVKGESPNLAALGDVKLKLLDQLNLSSQAVMIAYNNGAFEGTVDLLTVTLNISKDTKAIFEITNGKVDKNGFSAELVKLTYAYDSSPEQERENSELINNNPESGENTLNKSDVSDLLPGFNMDWVKNAGLETLVISASAASVRLGNDGLEVENVTKSLDRFSGKMFGAGAKFNGEDGSGSINGSYSFEPPTPSVNLVFVVVPGLELGLGIGTTLKLAAELNGTLTKKSKAEQSNFTPWGIGGNASINGTAGVEAKVSADLGSQFIASIGVDFFADANASIDLSADLQGTILNDDDSYKLKLSDKENEKAKATYTATANLEASLGSRIRAKAFYFYEKKLYEYRFKKWNLGNWSSEGAIFSMNDGSKHVEQQKGTFDGNALPSAPSMEYNEVEAYEAIDKMSKAGNKISDELLLTRLVYDITEIGLDITNSERQGLFDKILGFAANPTLVERIALQKMTYMNQRSVTGNHPSLVMTKTEWIKYSTTKGVISINTRRSVVPVDDAIDAYHEIQDLSSRKQALDKLREAINVYKRDSYANSRIKMIERLLNDTSKEMELLKELELSQ